MKPTLSSLVASPMLEASDPSSLPTLLVLAVVAVVTVVAVVPGFGPEVEGNGDVIGPSAEPCVEPSVSPAAGSTTAGPQPMAMLPNTASQAKSRIKRT
jgi:hypothetical protein